MEKITASLVIYNNDPATVQKAALSFLRCSLSGTLYVVDNSSTDKAREFFDYPNVVYLFSGSNLGYGKAHNVAIRKILETSNYHLVLNPDVYFEPNVLEALFYFMEEHPAAGLAMPKVLYPNGALQHLCKLLPTPLNLATRRFMPFNSGFLTSINDYYEMKFSQYSKVMNVPFLSGCFMFMRTAALKETGLFDERFFLYAEDTDLSRRIHRHYKTLFFPSAQIYHTHARGSYKDLMLTWYNLRSAIQYFNKWGWFIDKDRSVVNQKARRQFPMAEVYESVILQATLSQQPVNE